MEKKKKIRTFLNFLLFLILIIITYRILFNGQDFSELIRLLGTVKIKYIIIAALCMCIYVCCEAINIGRTLKALEEKTSFFKNVKYALIGFFFSGITPAASGGQPMQIYFMHKEKISVANSTLALLINLSSMQIVTISLALMSFIFNHQYLNTTLTIFFIIGILLNTSAFTLLLIALFSKKSLNKMINFVMKIMEKIKIKNIEQKREKLETELEKYHNSSSYIKNNKFVIIKIILTTYIQFIFYYSITYWVYRSFGFSGYSVIQITSLQAILYGTVSGIPSPGAVGVTEGGYIEIFKSIIPKEMISSVIVMNRGINFYLLMIISGTVSLINIFRHKRIEKNISNDEQ